MKKLFLITLSCWLTFALTAAPPAGYYLSAEGKSTATLKTALYNIISSGTRVVSYDNLYSVYATSDVTASGNVWDMYSTCTWTPGVKKCGNYKYVCDCYNREHSIPQSWFNSSSPMVSDAFHVYPTDGKVNGQRSNFPFGECAGGTSLGGAALGRLGNSTFPGYSGKVFEPDDQYKGDFARTYFYFATRYQNIMSSIGGESFNNTTYPSFPTWTINLLLKWHRQDPVSQKEIDRNDAVQAHQRNRNPFIDYPELAEYIWGNQMGQVWNVASSVDETLLATLSLYPNPANDFFIVEAATIRPIEYAVYNAAGVQLLSGQTEQGSQINTANLNAGVYIVTLTIDSQRIQRRIVITR